MKPDSEPTPGKEGESGQERMAEEQMRQLDEQSAKGQPGTSAEDLRNAGLRLILDVLAEKGVDNESKEGDQDTDEDDPLWDEEWRGLCELNDKLDEARARRVAEQGEDADNCWSDEEMRISEEFWNSPIGKRIHERDVKSGAYEKMYESFLKATEEMDRRRANQKPNDEL